MLVAGPSSAPVFPEGAYARLSDDQFSRLQALSKAVLAAPTYSELFRILADFCQGVDAGAVNCAIFDNTRLEIVGVSSTMRPSAVDRYFAENLAQVDPLIPRIRSDPRPALLGWSFGLTELWQTSNSARMLDAMQMDGYFGLAYFPVHVAGSAFSATITIRNELEPERGQAFIEFEFGMLQMVAQIVGQRAATLFHERATDEHWHAFRPPLLTPREHEIVNWIAVGLGTGQIAYELGIKPVTVQMHLRSARDKLGARTRAQMIAQAASRGLL